MNNKYENKKGRKLFQQIFISWSNLNLGYDPLIKI